MFCTLSLVGEHLVFVGFEHKLLHEVKRYFLFFGWGLRLNVHDDYVDDNYMELHHFQLGVEV